jgi:hypothetical protein
MCGRGEMVDTSDSKSEAKACRFESDRPHFCQQYSNPDSIKRPLPRKILPGRVQVFAIKFEQAQSTAKRASASPQEAETYRISAAIYRLVKFYYLGHVVNDPGEGTIFCRSHSVSKRCA